MLLADFLKEATRSLEGLYPFEEARSVVFMLCEALLGTKKYYHIVEPEYEVPSSKEASLRQALDRLSNGEPIQYVIGRAEFCGLSFKVNDSVLIPRPETEMLCRRAIEIGNMLYRSRIPYGKNAAPVRILDLCTGSGCVAWTLALSVTNAEVTGVDISEPALEVARSQDFSAELKSSGASAPVFMKADVLDFDSRIEGKYDLILSNPPYIMESEKPALRRNVIDYEPSMALFVSDEDPLLFYRAVSHWSLRLLEQDGTGMTEINELLGQDTEALFKDAGFSNTEVVKDFYDKDRFIIYRR